MKTEITIVIPSSEASIIRVGDLELGTCFLKEHRLWIKQEGGYCIALDNFVRYAVRLDEQVEKVLSRVQIMVS